MGLQSLYPYGEPLKVELFLPGVRVSGCTWKVNDSMRLGDVLSAEEETFELRDVCLANLVGGSLGEQPEMVVEKRSIVAAVPWETEEYRRLRRLARAGVPRPLQARVRMRVVLPPFVVVGTAYLQPDRADLRAPGAAFDRFFPLTAAALYAEDRLLLETPILILQRDRVAAVGRLPVPGTDEERPVFTPAGWPWRAPAVLPTRGRSRS